MHRRLTSMGEFVHLRPLIYLLSHVAILIIAYPQKLLTFFSLLIMFQVSGRLSELKTTIGAGLDHRNILLETIGDKFEQWNLKVLSYLQLCFR